MADVTQILSQIQAGDPSAAEQLLPLVYEELRKLAAAKLAQEKPGQTLQATALVHEAYLRLVGDGNVPRWDNHRHFFGAAAEAMRRILVESARRRQSLKRGGDRQRIDLDEGLPIAQPPRADDLLALDEALTRLAELDPVRAELVKLRFFGGLSIPEASATLGVSRATAERHWTFAKTWLYCELRSDPPD
jgi:RNA polymerase sigma factor (TIGR02999 family)